MTHPLENLDPAQTVQVLPRHLAGAGAIDPRTVWAFPFDEGWSFAQTDAGTATAFSPCLRLQTTYDPKPDHIGKGTWTISAHQAPFTPPTWRITFDATTPVELLHDVHTELLNLYLEDQHSDRDWLLQDETAPHEAYTPLLTRGWRHDVKTDGTQTFLTPEGLGGVRHRYANSNYREPAWRAWGGFPSEPHWRARFWFGTPTTLVAAFTASLISTEPLHRAVKDVPLHTRRALYVATPTDKQPHGNTSVAPPPPTPVSGRTR
ncbi:MULTISPECIES: DUF317 domain-containing protein [unclassified Streptomyces]|uniref:DUF317 domain-containing protein n=1 Tax=unclassified Streptomyces TaxID=2593676 RepID=UPI002365BF20|nr:MULTISPECIES: DUF317 domain-containing protein [unclassified Streptomyces]MDF3145544.1 DUF317 domain-containing protein [Streptomyces sp. T21Q-yed]WDF43553.1 DUF317 domain-containing protein [Streptomyces sp. T12]